MKKFFESEVWSWIRTVIEIILIICGIVAASILFAEAANAETTECWVLCSPESYVCIHGKPSRNDDAFGGASCGTRLETDGKQRNGFLHVVNVPAEETTGWISAGYIVYSEPKAVNRTATVISDGRLAARKCVGGKIVKWLKPGQEITVIFRSDDWCYTSAGYVRTEFLRLEGEN